MPPVPHAELGLELAQFAAGRTHQERLPPAAQELQVLLRSNAAVKNPHPPCGAKARFHGLDDLRKGHRVMGVASEDLVVNGKAVRRHHQGEHDLLAVGPVITRIAALDQRVVLHQPFKKAAGQIAKQQIELQREQIAQPFFEITLDRLFGFKKLIQCAVETILGDLLVSHPQQILQSSAAIAVLRQTELRSLTALTDAQPGDDLDGHHGGRGRRLASAGDVAGHDRVEPEHAPKLQTQPDVAEGPSVRPADLAQADAHYIRISDWFAGVVFEEQRQFAAVLVAGVEDSGASPAAFLVFGQLAQRRDDALSWPPLSAVRLDQGEVGVPLAILGALELA